MKEKRKCPRIARWDRAIDTGIYHSMLEASFKRNHRPYKPRSRQVTRAPCTYVIFSKGDFFEKRKGARPCIRRGARYQTHSSVLGCISIFIRLQVDPSPRLSATNKTAYFTVDKLRFFHAESLKVKKKGGRKSKDLFFFTPVYERPSRSHQVKQLVNKWR